MPLPTDFAWAAGVIDGEGCIANQRRLNSSGRYSYTLRLSVSNTDPPMLRRLVELFGGKIFRHKTHKGPRPIWQWIAQSHTADAALRTVLPYLITKLPQAQIALQVRELTNKLGCTRPNPNHAAIEELDSRLRSLKRETAA